MTTHRTENRIAWGPSRLAAFLCLLVTLLSLGCADADGPKTAATRQVLSLTYKVTLTTPNPVSPTAPVVVGSNSVKLGAAADVTSGLVAAMGSGGLWLDPDASLNETWSRGTATLKDRARVRGILHARTRSNGSNVSVASWDQNPAFDPPQTLSWDVTYPTGPAPNFTLNDRQLGSLSPDRWGDVVINSQASLMLSTGKYYLKSLSLQSGASIQLNQAQGPVIIYVTDALSFRGSFVPLDDQRPHVLVAYLGTAPIFIEQPFEGALVAPFSTLTLRATPGRVHSGYFYAKDVVLDAGARVKNETPVALITAGGSTGATCRERLGDSVPPKDLPLYCDDCKLRIDSDGDGTLDCADECAFDPAKIKGGQCGCGVAETDTDGDRVPDCDDPCDLDPNNTTPGQCGCLSSRPYVRAPVPAGTKCTDPGCPQSGPLTCNADGVCGSRTNCAPVASVDNCTFAQFERSSYWFCTGPLTQSAAAQACRSKQMVPVRIEGFSENAFVRRFAASPIWIGANSITTSGVWRWSTATSNNGDQFWQGGITGSQSGGRYSKWAEKKAPAAQRCAAMQVDGSWVDVDCAQALGFACETSPAVPSTSAPLTLPGQPAQPPAMNCSDDGVPLPPEDGFDELVGAVDASNEVPPRFVGAGADPPPDAGFNDCVNDDNANAIGMGGAGGAGAGIGCTFERATEEPGFSCFEDKDCAELGVGLVCRQVKDDADCIPELAIPCPPNSPNCVPVPAKLCSGSSHCGKLDCPATPAICQQFDICPPGTDIQPNLDGSTLDAVPFNPGSLFDGGTVPPATSASVFNDPPTGQGKDHSWCFMGPQQAIPNAKQVIDQQQGQAGKDSPIKFAFDPNLTFDANVNPLAFGESDLDVHARAELIARVELNNFLGISSNFDILSAVADLRAKRCTVSSAGTHFKVFGKDFISYLGIPTIDNSNTQLARDCNAALDRFVTAANRAKKAFRDAQQLLAQYRATGLRNLCPQLMATLGANPHVPYFPDGLVCPTHEPTEFTINRFIDYYQAPGVGVASQLRDAVGELSAATSLFKTEWKRTIKFGPQPKGESVTLARAQFMVGPVPVMLELDAFYTYGAAGTLEIGLEFPYDPFSAPGVTQDNDIAFVKAGVLPFAAAGLTAFVGAGRSLGPISGSVGLEGSVTLGDVKAPIFVGAGIGARVETDARSLPSELAPVAAAYGLGSQFGVPKNAKFYVWYNYGAAIDMKNILKGEVNGRVRIKFAFFSRTWRKRIVSFRGLPDKKFDLLSGKTGGDPEVSMSPKAVDYSGSSGVPGAITANVVEGKTSVGYSEPQLPLLALQTLPVPTQEANPDAGADFDPGQVQGMFYDDLCCAKLSDPVAAGVNQCALPGERPRPGLAPCCAGLECAATPDGTRCQVPYGACLPEEAVCTLDSDCCGDWESKLAGDCVSNRCSLCGESYGDAIGAECEEDSDCCGANDNPPTAYCAGDGPERHCTRFN